MKVKITSFVALLATLQKKRVESFSTTRGALISSSLRVPRRPLTPNTSVTSSFIHSLQKRQKRFQSTTRLSVALEPNDQNEFKISFPTTEDMFSESKFDPFLLIPLILPFLAYASFDYAEMAFGHFYEFLAKDQSFHPVDGGKLQANLISPTLNGIVLPMCTFLFSTLVSTSISTLRNRLTSVKECLTKEAGDLQKLVLLLEYFPTEAKAKSQHLIYNYCQRLIEESNDGYNHDSFTGSIDVEINKLMMLLNELELKQNVGEDIPRSISDQSLIAIDNLNENRLSRMTQLREPFPVLHYIILGSLPIAIIFSFLMQTNNDTLRFLDEIQLKILWTMLFGVLSLIAVVIYDLQGPFRGSYRVSNAIEQVQLIKRDLEKEMSMN